MEVKDAAQMKLDLEDDLTRRVEEFQRMTGLRVYHIIYNEYHRISVKGDLKKTVELLVDLGHQER